MERTIEFPEETRIYAYERAFMYGLNFQTFKGILVTKKVLVQTVGKRTAYVYNYHEGEIVSSYVLNRPFRLEW